MTATDATAPPTAVATPPGADPGAESVVGLVADTTPYPWPWDAALSADRVALVVAGWDRDWMGRTSPAAPVLDRIFQLASLVRVTFAVAHHHTSVRIPPHGADRAVPHLPGASEVVAAGLDGFYGSPLDGLLRATGRDQLLLVGLGLEGPVHSTMRSANDAGYECLLVIDACAPIDPDLIEASRSMVEMSGGIFGAVGETAPTVAALELTAPGGNR